MIGSKVRAILPPFFSSKNSKTSNVGIWGVYPEAIDCNIVMHTWTLFLVSVSEEKALSEPKTYKIDPISLSVFGIQLQISSPKRNPSVQCNILVYCLWINTPYV